MSDSNDPLEALIQECLLRMDAEGSAALDDMCRRHPEHSRELRAALDYLRSAEMIPDPEGEQGVPDRLGEFRLLRRLGGGGMGVVFLAEQESLGRKVALKLIRPEQLFFERTRKRFQREVEAIARLQHPGIVPVHAFGEENGMPYFAMEHIHGCSLADVVAAVAGRAPESLRGKDLQEAVAHCTPKADTPDEAGQGEPAHYQGTWSEIMTRLVLEVAQAIAHAHRRGVLHRDLKPSNIMVTKGGRIQVVDFGLAYTEGDQSVTASGSVVGSLVYMSPEQVEGVRDIGAASDVYSLGVTLYELLALRCPYHADTAEHTKRKILYGVPVPPSRYHTGLSRDLETVCLKAMDRVPSRRYQTMADFATDLGNVLAKRPVTARRPGVLLRTLRFAQRRPAVAALILVLAVSVPAIAGLWGFQIANQQLVELGKQAEQKRFVQQKLVEAWMIGSGPRRAQSEAAFDAVLKVQPDNALAIVGKALHLFEDEQLDKSLAVLQAHPEVIERHPAIHNLLLLLYEHSGRSKEAKAAFEQTKRTVPNTPIDCFIAGVFEMSRGHEGVVEVYPRAVYWLDRAITLSKEAQPVFFMKLAEAAARARDVDQVERMVTAIDGQWPDSAPALAVAGNASSAFRPDVAVDLLEDAVRLDPELLEGWRYLGWAYVKAKKLEKAKSAYERAIKMAPDDGNGYTRLAYVHHLTGDTDKALLLVEEAIKRPPVDSPTYETKADLLLTKGDTEGALANLDLAIPLAPYRSQPVVAKAELLIRQQRFDEAIRCLKKAVQRRRHLPAAWAHGYLAEAYRRAQMYEKALPEALRAAELDRRNPQYVYEQAYCKWKLGDHQAANALFETTCRMTPKDPGLHRIYMEFLREAGDTAAIQREARRWAEANK